MQIRSVVPNLPEIDFIIVSDSTEIAVEIKSSATMNPDFFNGLLFWQNMTGESSDYSALIYGGTLVQGKDYRLERNSKNI